jgi:M3 family oligoendopeptidase
MQTPTYSAIAAATPTPESLQADYGAIDAALDSAETAAEWEEALRDWDALRRRLGTWHSLTNLHFSQDTRNPEYVAAREYADALAPKIESYDVTLKRRFLASPHRPALERKLGTHLFALWSCDVVTFDPRIEDDLVVESQLSSDYTALLAKAEVEFDGKRLNLASIGPYLQAPERDVRHAAQRAKWRYFEAHRDELDRFYDKLVELRTAMARKLGYENYIGLGYARMRRTDYDQNDVERYREEIARTIVPLAHEVVNRRARALGLERPMFWDEAIGDPGGNPKPLGDDDWLVARLGESFAAIDPGLGAFAGVMRDGSLIDYKNRAGKAMGGFCTSFPTDGVPYIFANFNGTDADVTTIVHEMGHAFQNWRSRSVAQIDELWPTMESAEIHSMSLEYLAFPQMERFFGESADRFRRKHLSDALLFLPYGVAVDHFQHLVYAAPGADPAERALMWQSMEERYLPWRAYGDLTFPAGGRVWQQQRHIYSSPFYYIDYTLALCCALQFWVASREDYGDALARYVALAGLGGTRGFRGLVESAGLQSPFEKGVLARVADEAAAALELV